MLKNMIGLLLMAIGFRVLLKGMEMVDDPNIVEIRELITQIESQEA